MYVSSGAIATETEMYNKDGVQWFCSNPGNQTGIDKQGVVF